MAQPSRAELFFFRAVFVIGLLLVGIGVVLYSPGSDVTNVLALFFGLGGAYLAMETVGRAFGWEK